MSPDLSAIGTLISGCAAGWAVYITRKKDRGSQKTTDQINAGALELEGRRDAAKLLSDGVEQAVKVRDETISRLIADVAEIRKDLDTEKRRSSALEQHVGKMQNLLHEAGIPVPAFSYETDPEAKP